MKRFVVKYSVLPKQIKASLWFLICSFLQRGISTLTTPIFTRLLSTAEYGNYNVFNSWLGIITIIVSMHLYSGMYSQGLVKFDKDRNIFSSSLQGLSLTLVIAWTVVYLISKDFWNNVFSLTTVQMLVLLLMIWTSAIFGYWSAEQRVKLSYVKLVVLTLVVSVAKPVVGIIFVVHANDKVTARALGIALVELICYFPLFVSQMRGGRKFFSAKFWKYGLAFSLPLIPHYLSQTVLSSSDRIMISRMVGEEEAGIYSLAYSISLTMLLFNTALGQTIAPWMYQKIKEKNISKIAPITYNSLVVIATVNLLLIALAPEVVSIFAPASYHNAIWVIPPVNMSAFFMFLYDRFCAFEFYYEKTKFMMSASLIAATSNIMLNFIFIRHFGYVAAGYTTLLCYMIYAFAHYICVRKICRAELGNQKPFDIKIILVIMIIFMTLGFIFLVLYNHNILRYISIGVISLIIVIFWKKFALLFKNLLVSKKTF